MMAKNFWRRDKDRVFLDESRFKTKDLLKKWLNTCKSMLKYFSRIVADFDDNISSSILLRENEVDRLTF